MSKARTIIYKDTTLDNTGFIIAIEEEKTTGVAIRFLDDDNPVYSSDEQSLILKEFCEIFFNFLRC